MSQCPSCGVLADGSYCSTCGTPLPLPVFQQYAPPPHGQAGYGHVHMPPPYAYPYQYAPRSNALGVIALVFGILSLITCVMFIVGALPALVAIITGYLGRKEGQEYASVGMWMGVAGLLISTVGWFLFFALIGAVMGPIW